MYLEPTGHYLCTPEPGRPGTVILIQTVWKLWTPRAQRRDWWEYEVFTLYIPPPGFRHTSWVTVVTPTDRNKSVRNRCVIEFYGVVYVWSRCFLDLSVTVGAFVKGLSQIFTFFYLSLKNWVWYAILREKNNANVTPISHKIILKWGILSKELVLFKIIKTC